MENLKKIVKNKDKVRTIYPKNHENFKNSKCRVQSYWFLRCMWSLALSFCLYVAFLLENVNYIFLDCVSDVFDFHEY